MKKIYLFCFILGGFLIIACSKFEGNSVIFPQIENLEIVPSPSSYNFKENVWTGGLINHIIRNTEVPPTPLYQVSFDDVKALNYGTNFRPYGVHYKLVNSITNALISTINLHYKSIDGIFVGVAPGNLDTETLIISLVKIDSIRSITEQSCTVEKMRYYKPKSGPMHFKCTDRNLGIWESIPSTDPLLIAFNKNKNGIFIGKKNLFEQILGKSPAMYLYTGFDARYTRHFVAVDKPYFSQNTTLNPDASIGAIYSPPTSFSNNPQATATSTIKEKYLSTLKDTPTPKCINQRNNNYITHGTIRPCPNNCPE